MSNEVNKKSNRRKLILLLLLLLTPVVISYTLFFTGYRPGSINYGEILDVQKLSGSGVTQKTNIILRIKDLHGKWVMLTIDSGQCDEACQSKLYYMRQVRTMQNKEMHRIERLWLVDDNVPVEDELWDEYDGTIIVNARASELLDLIPTREIQRNHIYLIDPLGNLMMRFPENLEPKKMSEDIKRLLHVSQLEH
ncbi:MAG TPA: hypothetical protein PKM20_02720 [Nitrosomonas sp.]|uniref:SCO family protein n=1 Tax=Nitrosomonas sp. TaxID=42353 RepID=UPI000E8AC4BD|nr:hypothetical protein [Nitrosomonas sp.]GJL75621.1 MAG: hypothetical protein NMNS02_17270 [Nitrosomonas sp.]HBV21795.1 hypothetical protein [Nitrosomonas sp.]HNP25630.1 hypothetical protein [Nitrosomonas sp.]